MGLILGLAQCVKDGFAVSCGVGHRRGLDLALLQLRCRPAAVAPIGPLAWEPSHASGVALKSKQPQQQQTNKQKTNKKPPAD